MSEIQYPVIGSSGWGEIMNNNLRELDARTGGSSGDITGRLDTLEDDITQLNEIANPNLLINGDFKINQRGKTSYEIVGRAGYSVDRWITYSLTEISEATTITPLSNGINVKGVSTSDGSVPRGRIRQYVEDSYIKGKEVTFSTKLLADCTDINFSISNGRNDVITYKTFYNKKAGDILSYTFTIPKDTSDFVGVQISSADTNGISVEYAKLELGNIATPFVSRPYAEELALCQRYFQVYPKTRRRMTSYSSKTFSTFFEIFSKMRVAPTVNISNIELRNLSGASLSGVTFTVTGATTTRFNIDATKENHGLTDAVLYMSENDSEVTLDAEIY